MCCVGCGAVWVDSPHGWSILRPIAHLVSVLPLTGIGLRSILSELQSSAVQGIPEQAKEGLCNAPGQKLEMDDVRSLVRLRHWEDAN